MKRYTEVGSAIKRLREKKGLTQISLAEMIGVSFQAVSAWERGASLPDLYNAAALANKLGVTVDTLLRSGADEYRIGVDAGGTKTEFMLVDAQGREVERFSLGGANPNDVSLDHTAEVLSSGLDRLTVGRNVASVFCGVAGVTAGDNAVLLRETLTKRYGTRIFVESDVSNLLFLGEREGCKGAVICGTGSVVFVRTDRGDVRVGGWGYLFDEKGSGYDVGKDALRHALACLDGLEKPDALSEKVEERLGKGIWKGLSEIYKKGRPYIASFAPDVVELAKSGDPKAESILKTNAERLGKIVSLASEKYGAGDVLLASGGFFNNEIYLKMVEEASGKRLIKSTHAPVVGACVGSFERAGAKAPDGLFEGR